MGEVIYLSPRPIADIANEVVADLRDQFGHQDGKPEAGGSKSTVRPTDLRAVIATADRPASSRR